MRFGAPVVGHALVGIFKETRFFPSIDQILFWVKTMFPSQYHIQKILVFQQAGSGEPKVKGIEEYGKNRFSLEIISIDNPLPPVLDDGAAYLPLNLDADLVLDYLTHPDLTFDLAAICSKKGIPVIASGKKLNIEGAFSPPT